MFNCCSLYFTSEEELDNHLRSPIHTGGSNICRICGVTFPSLARSVHHRAVGYHLIPPLASTSPFSCTICHEIFRHQHGLDKHLEAWRYRFRCQLCHMSCGQQHDLINHHRESHRTISFPPAAQRPPTNPQAPRETHLKTEGGPSLQQTQHRPPTHQPARQSCGVCDRDFATQQALLQHCDAVHQNTTDPTERRPSCGHCNMFFATQGSLDDHMRTSHGPGVSGRGRRGPVALAVVFTCPTCEKQFSTQQSLDHHVSAMHPQPQLALVFNCGICNVPFHTQRALEQHTTTVHQYICSHCDKVFASLKALDKHLVSAVHPGDAQQGRGVPLFRCDECDSVFEAKDLLTMHAVGHVRDRLRR